MQIEPKKFKSPPKRFQPRGLSVLYEDHDLLVVDKVSGLKTMGAEGDLEDTAYSRLNDYVRKGVVKSKNRVYILNRLEKDTSGVLVAAKNEQARDYLLKEWPKFKRMFCAVIHGILPEKEGVITSYLAENRIHKMYTVEDPKKGKMARTVYNVLRESREYTFLELELVTDLKNQVRVQFSDMGHPVTGDKIYGNKDKGIKKLGLHALSITLSHPYTREEMTFAAPIPGYLESLIARR